MLKNLSIILSLGFFFSIPCSFLNGMESNEPESIGQSNPKNKPPHKSSSIQKSQAVEIFPYKKSNKLESLLERCIRGALNKLHMQFPEQIKQQLTGKNGVPEELCIMLGRKISQPQDEAQNTLLHKAGSVVRVKQLLALGIDYNCRNIYDETALMTLLKKLKTNEVIALLENAPQDLDVNCQDCVGEKPLQVASRINDSKVKELLIKRGAVQKWSEKLTNSVSAIFRADTDDIEEQKIESYIRLFMAQEFSLQDSINYFYNIDKMYRKKVKQGINRELSPFGITRLHLAETELDVQKLLFLKADYKKSTKYNENCLHYMIKSGNKKAALKLLEHLSGDDAKTECNLVDHYHMTPLCTAVLSNDTMLVKALVEKGADVDYMYQTENGAIFINVFHVLALHKDNRAMMEFLFSKSNKELQPEIIITLMISAIEYDNAFMLYKLLPQGFDFNTYAYKNYNLLMHALAEKHLVCADKLLTEQALVYDEKTQQVVPVVIDCLQKKQ